MKIYWLSNAPHSASGYGQQTDLWTQLMVRDGHEVVIRANFGLQGAPMRDGIGRLVLPTGYNEHGDDLTVLDWQTHKPDAGVVLYDAWVFSKQSFSIPLTYYSPVDHAPIPALVAQRLGEARHVWAMSRYGEREMRQAGLDPWYVPHGINTRVFTPVDRQAARAKFGLKDEQFFAVSVAANKGFPDRKNIRGMVKAWAEFVKLHPDALLHIHANSLPNHHGLDLTDLRAFYGLTAENLRFPEIYKLINGSYRPEDMNTLYNAADVFLLPSMGEGFGIPVIEAQAAGCPVIVSDFTAQTELCGAGWRCEVDPLDDCEFTLQGSEQCRVKPSVILNKLIQAFEARHDSGLREKARAFGLTYEAADLWEKYMLPALRGAAGVSEPVKLPPVAAEPVPELEPVP